MPATIRPATPTDAPAIAHVHVESWKTTYAAIFPPAVLTALSTEKRTQFWREHITAPPPSVITLVACDLTGRVVGFIDGGRERTGQLGPGGELYAIYLLEGTQRQGIGTQLVTHLASHLLRQGFQSMAVWVLDANPSKHFYEALGAKLISQQILETDGKSYLELAYAWDKLDHLVGGK